MTNLLEALQNSPSQQSLDGIVRAGSGKQQTAVSLSNERERAALGAAKATLQQQVMAQAPQVAQAEQEDRSITQEKRGDEADFLVKSKALTQGQAIRKNEILESIRQGTMSLDMDKFVAEKEQLGFQIRLENDKYVSSLENEARRAGIVNDATFRTALQEDIWGEEMDLFKDRVSFAEMTSASNRDFERMISNMSLDDAMELARHAIKSESTKGMFEGTGKLASAGAETWANSKDEG